MLAFIAIALVGLSVLAILAIMIIGGAGVKKPLPQLDIVYIFPVIGLPLGALCIIALVVVNAVERRKLNTRQVK
ncbi:MAG TPA: hypothetical protein VGC45_15255 [Gryllotalpicola sp.]